VWNCTFEAFLFVKVHYEEVPERNLFVQ